MNVRDVVKENFRETLVDPESLRFIIDQLRKPEQRGPYEEAICQACERRFERPVTTSQQTRRVCDWCAS